MCTRKAIPRRVTFETPSKSVAAMQEQQQFQQQQTFPFKLYNMLEYACDSEFSSCISWTADGSAFIIHDKEAMMDDLAPMFFNQTKFRSFVSDLQFDRSVMFHLIHRHHALHRLISNISVYVHSLFPSTFRHGS
mmetsp:Transcript_21987/g.33958  ORF Transcript_21987/g.33958 Transcript_21987/m.33958 type:complete len:134 (+) Transcript_21987:74-475(+)